MFYTYKLLFKLGNRGVNHEINDSVSSAFAYLRLKIKVGFAPNFFVLLGKSTRQSYNTSALNTNQFIVVLKH